MSAAIVVVLVLLLVGAIGYKFREDLFAHIAVLAKPLSFTQTAPKRRYVLILHVQKNRKE